MNPFSSDKLSSSWIELSSSALIANIREMRKLSNQSFQIGAVLKGNAYGHGLQQIFPILQPLVDCIYVITAEDALLMRSWEKKLNLTQRRIVVIGTISLHNAILCSRHKIEVAISDTTWKVYAKYFSKNQLKLKIHIHFDTGLSREGFSEHSLLSDLTFLQKYKDNFHVVGFMSHFANTEDVTEQNYALGQLKIFKKMGAKLKLFLNLGNNIEEHISASAGALVLPQARLNIARVGISLYGLWPSAEARISAKYILKRLPKLTPVLTWKCKSQVTKWLKKGSFIGYGCTHRCSQETRIAVFPVGYFDGYPRLASGKAHVLINHKRCPILGRVMMNHIIVDITQIHSSQSQVEAILLGKDSDESLPAELIATWAQTINYELVTRIGTHLPRIVVK